VDVRNPAEILGGLIPHARFTTVVILLINAGFYLAMMVFSAKMNLGGGLMSMDGETLFAFGAKYRAAINAGQWWRFITAGFLHGGLLHIGMNSWAMFDLGTHCEQEFGTARYIVFYIFSTVTGYLASFYWSNSLSVGASAGIFGLIGAMIAMGIRDKSAYGAAVKSAYGRWAVYGLIMGFVFSYTDNAAHIGGIAGGFALAYVAGTPSLRPEREMVWKILAWIAVGVTVYSVFLMVRQLLTLLQH
jgi:rhomboid protease GluP